MNSSAEVIFGTKGQIVCRPTSWTDILKFFVFNYGLHVLTIASKPGSGKLSSFSCSIIALLLPFSGVLAALNIIRHYKWDKSDTLHIAHRAGALCMVVQGRPIHLDETGRFVIPAGTDIHGQYPVSANATNRVGGDGNESVSPPECSLVIVPRDFTVTSLRNSGSTRLCLSSNYTILKGLAGIAQVVYGSLELYVASNRQFQKFGYGSYSLTVIPYVLMSFINLLAALCEPQYPAMFLVLYRGPEIQPQAPVNRSVEEPVQEHESPATIAAEGRPVAADTTAQNDGLEADRVTAVDEAAQLVELEAHISGAVGEGYGDISASISNINVSTGDVFGTSAAMSNFEVSVPNVLVLLGGLCCIAAPYIIILLLTGFKTGQSTRSQRAWMMTWLVIGQIYGSMMHFRPEIIGDSLRSPEDSPETERGVGFIDVVASLVLGCATIGGFVVVGQMMT